MDVRHSACPDDGRVQMLDVVVGLVGDDDETYLVRAADQRIINLF